MTMGQEGATVAPSAILRADVAVVLAFWLDHPDLTERDLSVALDRLARAGRCVL